MKRIFRANARTLAATLAALVAIATVDSAPARAQQSAEPVRIIANKATILRLTKPAQNIIIGDLRFVDVTVETRSTLVLFGRAPGETNLIVLDSQYREILSVPVIVTDEKDRHISIVSAGKGGQAEVVYNCEERCVRVTLQGAAPAASGGGQGPVPTEPAAAPAQAQPQTQAPEQAPAQSQQSGKGYKR